MILDRLIDAVPVPRVAHDGLIARAEAADRGALVGRARPNPTAERYARPNQPAEPFAFDERERSA
jgi:hypothetical protein